MTSVIGDNGFTPGKKTSEWKALLIMFVKNAVIFLVLLGWISSGEATEITDRITALIGALGMAGVEGFGLWRYISSRSKLKEKSLSEYFELQKINMKIEDSR